MTIKVAINGFGRIGRNVARAIISDHSHEIDLLAINDSAQVETNLHLLKYDSIHGTLADEIEKISFPSIEKSLANMEGAILIFFFTQGSPGAF